MFFMAFSTSLSSALLSTTVTFPPPLASQATRAGLSGADAQARLEQYGPNRLPEKKRYAILQFLGYMWNPLSWAMEAAAILAIALLDYVDFILILGLLILNATISFVEESNADKAIKVRTSSPTVPTVHTRCAHVQPLFSHGEPPQL